MIVVEYRWPAQTCSFYVRGPSTTAEGYVPVPSSPTHVECRFEPQQFSATACNQISDLFLVSNVPTVLKRVASVFGNAALSVLVQMGGCAEYLSVQTQDLTSEHELLQIECWLDLA